MGIALCYLAGTWCGLLIAIDLLSAVSLCVLLWIWAALTAVRRPRGGNAAGAATVLPHLVIVFTAWFAASAAQREYDDRPILRSCAGKRIEIVGTVISDPESRDVPGRNRTLSRFRLAADYIGADSFGGRRPVIRVGFFGSGAATTDRPKYGDRWRLTGRLEETDRQHSRVRIAEPSFTADARDSELVAAGQGNPFIAWCMRMRVAASECLKTGIEDYPEITGILNAIVLGYRGQLSNESRDLFANVGVLHIFAVSGLHVGIVTLFVTFLLGSLRVSREKWILLLAPLLVIYTVITGARASAVRACVMAIAYYLAPLTGRRSDVVSALSVAALAILIFDPSQLFDVGFAYSFAVVTGLVLLYPVFIAPFRRKLAPDPFRIQPERPLVRLLRGAGSWAASLVAVSCAAWISSAPLTAHYFGRFSPIALIGNIVVVPLAFLVVLTGCLSIALGSCLMIVADIFNHANLAIVSVLMSFAKLAYSVPYGSFEFSRPGIAPIFAWYAAACVLAYRFTAGRAGQSGHGVLD